MKPARSVPHLVDNFAGWRLSLHQTWSPEALVPGRRPVLLVPGYGMNSFIFSFHPRGVSLQDALVQAGFEVWRLDLRGQGDSIRAGGSDHYGLEELAFGDLGAALRAVLDLSPLGASRVDVVGASLGGTLMLLQAALGSQEELGSLVTMGSPVRWVETHPAVRLVFGSRRIAGAVSLKGTRRLAEIALPHVARRLPWLLSLYLNPQITDLGATSQMVRTVEDPSRHLNREIAAWIQSKDLVFQGIRLADALPSITRPLLCIAANGDGVVPMPTAEFAYHHVGSKVRKRLVVGTPSRPMAHADLFVSDDAPDAVFHPLADWLAEQNLRDADVVERPRPQNWK